MEEFATKHGRDSSTDNEQRFAQALAACREGRLKAWTSLCLALSQPKTRHDDSAFFQTSDVRELAGWVAASDELRTEIMRFAREFLLRVTVAVAEPRQIPADYFGLVYALSLHADRLGNDPELLSASRPVWILALVRHCTPESKAIQRTLASLTSIAPAIVADAYKHELRERWDRNELIFDVLLSFAWTPGTEAVLAETLEATPLQPQSYTSGLQLLVRQNPHLAKQIALRRLTDYSKQPDSVARRAAIAACLFIIDDLWTAAWPHVVDDRLKTRQLLLEVQWLARLSRAAAAP